MRITNFGYALRTIATIILFTIAAVRAGDELLVATAASLQNPMEAICKRFESEHPGTRVILSPGASGALQAQIEHGAPVDVFLSAADKHMDALGEAGLLMGGTRVALVGNSLVLIAPKDSELPKDFAGLASPSIQHIAIGDPASVPAGHYAVQVFAHFDLTDAIRGRRVLAKDVRQVLTYVESGNADAGMVYESELRGSQAVRLVAVAPDDSHDPIVISAAGISRSENVALTRSFLEFLSGPDALGIFEDAGFRAINTRESP